MNHPVETFGFRVEQAGRVLAYSADTGDLPEPWSTWPATPTCCCARRRSWPGRNPCRTCT